MCLALGRQRPSNRVWLYSLNSTFSQLHVLWISVERKPVQQDILVMGGPFRKASQWACFHSVEKSWLLWLSRAAKLVQKLHPAEQNLTFLFCAAAVCYTHPSLFPWATTWIWKIPWREIIHSSSKCTTASRTYLLQTGLRQYRASAALLCPESLDVLGNYWGRSR